MRFGKELELTKLEMGELLGKGSEFGLEGTMSLCQRRRINGGGKRNTEECVGRSG